MVQFTLIILCLILGQACRFYPKFSSETAKVINAFVLYISLPAVIILKVPELIKTINLSFEILIPISMPWLMLIISYLLFYNLGKKLHWSREKTAAIILTAGLANTSFVGFPLLEALKGPDSIKIAVIADQLGTFLTFSTIGLFIGNIYSKGQHSPGQQTHFLKHNLINILRFPPFIILVSTGLLSFLGISPPPIVIEVVTPIAKTLGPLALFAVGFGLKINPTILKIYLPSLILGMGYKLILAPLIFTLLYFYGFGAHSEMSIITILESAMASMITASVICSEFDLEPDLANLMVGISIPLSLITVPLWNLLLSQ